MIVVTIDVVGSESSEDRMFGDDAVVVKYRPPGAKLYHKRGAGDDPASTRKMLDRAVDEVMRIAFPPVAGE